MLTRANPSRVYANPSQVYANPSQEYANPSWVYATSSQVYANPPGVYANPPGAFASPPVVNAREDPKKSWLKAGFIGCGWIFIEYAKWCLYICNSMCWYVFKFGTYMFWWTGGLVVAMYVTPQQLV